MIRLDNLEETELEALSEFLSELIAWSCPDIHLDPDDALPVIYDMLKHEPFTIDTARIMGISIRSLGVNAKKISWS